MKNIKLLDVTLRDGGCVNNFNFGKRYMDLIIDAISCSGVDYIEVGYIDSSKGSDFGRTQYSNEKVIYQNFLKNKNPNTKYLAMIDHNKFDIDKLEPQNNKGIDGIRYCFHKKDRKVVIPILRQLVSLGYETFAQPMITLRYSEEEIKDFLNDLKSVKGLSGVYIVDSFGEMKNEDVERMFNLFNIYAPDSLAIGYHSHNNLQLSYSNAVYFMNHDTDRTIMIDSSVLGMGKGAGNLNTELIMEHLNSYYNRQYNINPILILIDKVIGKIKADYYWGYSLPYFLSSKNHCTPSYAAFFDNKNMLSVNQLSEILSVIAEEKRISFDKDYAEKLYEQYNERYSVDDKETVDELKKFLNGKNILLIAPGHSLKTHQESIQEVIDNHNPVVIHLNYILNTISKNDYVLVCREEALKNIDQKCVIIGTSNISNQDKLSYVLDYKKWIIQDNSIVRDSAMVIALNLLSKLSPKTVFLAGFDGYSIDINSNYFDEMLSKEISKKTAIDRNTFAKNFISSKKKEMTLVFITPSLYE